jgi:enamine deaminase RidA (YjgF/YER057c/UK114 family)
VLKAVNPPGAGWPGVSTGILGKGSSIFVSSGHVGTDKSGGIVTSSLESQLIALFEGLGRTLAAAGLGFEHIARVTYYVTDYEPALLETLRMVRSRYLNQETPPASVLVGVAALYDPRLRVEAEVIAVVP